MLDFLIISFIIGFCFNLTLKSKEYSGPRTDHFDGRIFFNLQPVKHRFDSRENRLSELIVFSLKKLDSHVWKKRPLPAGKTTPEARVFGKNIVVTFVNHSTLLIQTESLNIITDPVWANRASPFSFLGPRRYMEPGIDIDKLPPIDIILLSHNHYDHMDVSALRKIRSANPKAVLYTTLGNSAYLATRGVMGGIDMDWGQQKKHSDYVAIECVPAQHFSARALSDRNRTLWGGFVIKTPHGDIYFAGDTGYGPCISHIKKMFPEGFRLAFLPIGAYEPRTFMRSVHASPEDAVTIYKEVGAKRAIPIHFGTFDLALDGQDDPVRALSALLREEENKNVRFDILLNGQKVCITGA